MEAVQVQAPGRRHGLHHGAGVGEVVVARGPVTRGQGVAVRTRVVAADLAPPNQLQLAPVTSLYLALVNSPCPVRVAGRPQRAVSAAAIKTAPSVVPVCI